jgi:voltage-gated potassium channel
VTWGRLLKTMIEGVIHDPNFPALAGAVGLLLVVGTLFYSLSQGWSLIDSFYFSVTTLTTVGYGDLAPEGEGARLATVAYQLSGIGLLVIFLSDIARRGMSSRHGETTDDDSGSSD